MDFIIKVCGVFSKRVSLSVSPGGSGDQEKWQQSVLFGKSLESSQSQLKGPRFWCYCLITNGFLTESYMVSFHCCCLPASK